MADATDLRRREKGVNNFALRSFNALSHNREISGVQVASVLLQLPTYYTIDIEAFACCRVQLGAVRLKDFEGSVHESLTYTVYSSITRYISMTITGDSTYSELPEISRVLPISADFTWQGLIAPLLQTKFQQWDTVCSLEVIKAVGVCALSAADCTEVDVYHTIHFPAVDLLGEQFLTIMHQRCEAVVGIPLPKDWPPYPDAFKQLDEAIKTLIDTTPKDSARFIAWGNEND
ncbi:hypothetical protein BGW36DRAFT_429907 [Talaromyces proteolyticus]|uniref:Uncharacterized protein n=1 Tax=Talaromyces proteolyticus TaxID=1131652 RepID=A0AAD4PTT3_9EURO|nr:uncharacterized protein BGW36DRAFT_429907 [Talaromyces proteolyticus]KAH8693878.1 hypothetical protein BGW36DRAFT_429907 [Talaromyces proteolyticus]